MSQVLILCIAFEMKRRFKLLLGFLLSLFCLYEFLVVTENPRLLDFNRDLKSLVKPNHSTALIFPQAKPSQTYQNYLIVVVSKPDNFLARKAIRETWGKSEPVIFLLGKSKSSVKNELVQIESKDNGDVLMEDFMDDYYNLTLKSIMMLKYVTQFDIKPTFVLKIYDDVFINLKAFKRILTLDYQNSIRGYVRCGLQPIRWATKLTENPKWICPLWMYSKPKFPDFLSGLGYLIPSKLIDCLYEKALHTPALHLEDVFVTGILRTKCGGMLIHDARFVHSKDMFTEVSENILIHPVTNEEHYVYHKLSIQ